MTPTPIVALDVASLEGALRLVDRLGESCDFYKVGSELFTVAGPAAVEALRGRGKEVFLDLKLHDIPNTVRGAAQAAARHGASLLTVHSVGGEEMVAAAVDGAGETCRVLGVTVLTSLDDPALAASWGRVRVRLAEEVVRLAGVAQRAGAHGVVCGGGEIGTVRDTYEGLAVLVPGVRFADGSAHDQRRVITPAGAAVAGATYLVLGRAVTAAADPVAAMQRVRTEVSAGVRGGSGAAHP